MSGAVLRYVCLAVLSSRGESGRCQMAALQFSSNGQRLWSMPVMYHTFLRPKVVRTAQARSLIKARLLPESGHV